MKYQSKKDPNVFATLEKTEEKFNTVILKLETGENAGKTISITTSTLKRWWSRVTEESVEKSVEDVLGLDMNKITEPYKPDVTPHYIKKPDSVIEYEAKKKKKYNSSLPDFDEIVEALGSKLSKVNEKSAYVAFQDKSTLWRKSGCIDMYVTQGTWEKLTMVGITSSPNKDKVRPFAIKVTSIEDYNKVLEALNE